MMQQDWHSADIIAGLRKRGTSLAALSRQAGLASSTLANALNRHWPKGERLIAEALGVPFSALFEVPEGSDGPTEAPKDHELKKNKSE